MGIATSSCRGKSVNKPYKSEHNNIDFTSPATQADLRATNQINDIKNDFSSKYAFKETPRIRIYRELERIPSRRDSTDSIVSYLNSKSCFFNHNNNNSNKQNYLLTDQDFDSRLANSHTSYDFKLIGTDERPVYKTRSLYYIENNNNNNHTDKSCQVDLKKTPNDAKANTIYTNRRNRKAAAAANRSHSVSNLEATNKQPKLRKSLAKSTSPTRTSRMNKRQAMNHQRRNEKAHNHTHTHKHQQQQQQSHSQSANNNQPQEKTHSRPGHTNPKNQNHFYYYHHHHHHYHHINSLYDSNNKLDANNLNSNIENNDMRVSPTVSIMSDYNSNMARTNTISVFSALYNQVSNNSCKVVEDDPSSSMNSLNQSRGSPREKNKPDEANADTTKNYHDLSKFESLPSLDNIDAVKCSITRLAKIKEALDEPNEDFFNLIKKSDLKKNVDYFLKVLENVLQDERKRLMSEDDVLSEVEPDAVPNEVRNWLSMTFTRSVTNMKKKQEEKPKFKSVAQAIRAGIMVDRMLRRMSSSLESNVPAQVSRVLKTLNEWNFEVFAMNDCSDGQALRYLGFELMQKFNILSKFKIQNLVMQNFLEAVEAGYSKYKNPYHNLIHATDVLQTTYHILNNAGLMNWLTSIEIFATFVSAIIHDYEHTGTTNNFHMQTRSDIALVYNDKAILENYHLSATFKLMLNDSYNILQELTRDEYKEFRLLVIDMVLATDMSYHFTQLKTVKNMISLNENIDKPKALSLVLHCADISHPSKDWPLHERWTNLLVQEFFAQGDKEKELGLPFSPLCDRNNTPIAQSQIGFINFIVEPSMSVMGDMIDKIFEQILSDEQSRTSKSDIGDSNSSSEPMKKPIERPWVVHLAENKSKWQILAEEEKQKNAANAVTSSSPTAIVTKLNHDNDKSHESHH